MILVGYRRMLVALSATALTFMTVHVAKAQMTCSNASLKGSCVLLAVTSPTTAGIAAGSGPEAVLGLMTFDGAGNFTIRVHKNANGQAVELNNSGTYTLQSNCDGQYTFTNTSTGETDIHDIVLSPQGQVLRDILISTQGRTTTLRVTAGVCKFNE
jgi:hypothetical protein